MSNEQSTEQGSNMVEALRFENRQLREANSELHARAQKLAIEKRQLAVEKQAATDEVALLRSVQEANEKRFEQEMLRLTAAYEKELQALKEQLTARQQLPSVETLQQKVQSCNGCRDLNVCDGRCTATQKELEAQRAAQKAPGPVEQHSSAVALVKALTELQRDSASLLTHLQEKVLGQARDIDVLIEENTKLNKDSKIGRYREELNQQHKRLDEVRALYADYELVLEEMAARPITDFVVADMKFGTGYHRCRLCTGDVALLVEDIRHTSSCLTVKARDALNRVRKEAKS